MSTAQPSADHDATWRTGRVLANRYRLGVRLGMGGMGEVYEAVDLETPGRFAIKVLRAEYSGDTRARTRFRREAEAALSLHSEHIVRVFDFDCTDDDGSPFLVMELLEGKDLRRHLHRHGRLGVAEAVDLVLQACAGVAVAHEHAIVHRDLKPENLFLAERGEQCTVKLLDFGIAKLRERAGSTANGKLLGTPAYMSPEQVRTPSEIDVRTDVYALGVILYEILTGELPHPGEGPHEIITHLLFAEPRPLCRWNASVPTALAEIVHKALLPAPRDRFQSVLELAEELGALSGSGVREVPSAASAAACAQSTRPALDSNLHANLVATTRPWELQPAARAVRRAPRWQVPLAVAGAAAFACAGAAWSRQDVLLKPHASVSGSVETSHAEASAPHPQPRRPSASESIEDLFYSSPRSARREEEPASTNLAHAEGMPGDRAQKSPTPRQHAQDERGRGTRARDDRAADHPAATTASVDPAAAASDEPAPMPAPEGEPPPTTLEIRRGRHTIVFMRENPLRR